MMVTIYNNQIWKVLLLTGGIVYLSELEDEGNNVKYRLNIWEHELEIRKVK